MLFTYQKIWYLLEAENDWIINPHVNTLTERLHSKGIYILNDIIEWFLWPPNFHSAWFNLVIFY